MNRNTQILGSRGQPTLPVQQSTPKMPSNRIGRVVAMALAGCLTCLGLFALPGCGQKGPLYLPAPASPASTPNLPASK